MKSFKTSFFAGKKEEKKSSFVRRRLVALREGRNDSPALKQRLTFSRDQDRYLPPELIDRICSFLNLNTILDVDTLAIFARFGNQDAQARLGYAYLRGINTEENRPAATKWLRLACKDKDPNNPSAPGLWALGLLGCWGISLREDKESTWIDAGYAWLKFADAAIQNYAPALFDLGRCYYHGRGVGIDMQDKQHAAQWFRTAAEQGYILAEYALGRCYVTPGSGLGYNPKESLYWITKSAEHGLIAAQRHLAHYYDNEVGSEENGIPSVSSMKALKWYGLLAKQKSGNTRLVRRRMYMLRANSVFQSSFLLFGMALAIACFIRFCFIGSSSAKDKADISITVLAVLATISITVAGISKCCLMLSSQPQNSPKPDLL